LGLFQEGAQTFIGWMTSIVPVVLMLMVLMNTIIAFLGEERMDQSGQSVLQQSRDTTLSCAAFPVGIHAGQPNVGLRWHVSCRSTINQATMASQAQFCPHKATVFPPHINPGRTVRLVGNCSRCGTARTEHDGLGDSLHAGRYSHEFRRRLGD